ncbi:peptidase [Rathayibacter tritici]|uniref:PepSY-associated TM helix domain-containing protein n=1 Tax=Rathayibacter tritici TaxID=33888 RepID=UPI000CE7454C|nr:PepSY-associated TM helix domain-containing protein [Rathayibacter tritici]PPF31874.1 peptidase [Rathayibacter tritici]PPI13170.1 peptidase [Rathayibacter tritici]
MTTTAREPRESADTPPPRSPRRSSAGWFGQLLLRLHFLAALFVGPFILVAAGSGGLYALTPQLEQLVYAQELHVPEADRSLPLADQIDAAEEYTGGGQRIVAVRPAPDPGDTTRVMFADPSLGAGETRAVFIDPATADVRGDLTAYGTSGALPLRTWVSDLHRTLHLGDVGRSYSELAASWLGVVALAGLGLWINRVRRARVRRDLFRPAPRTTGYRRLFSWHASTGIWLLVGALFLSATGITWSLYGGGNVESLRAALGWTTPSLKTTLGERTGDVGDEHAGHSGHAGHGGDVGHAAAAVDDPRGSYDDVLSLAREVNVNTGMVEIRPPAGEGSAWVVQEIQRSFPTEVDAVAIDAKTMQVVDRVDFADFGLVAKLSRWGIDTHMGSMFGLPNQLLLFVTAAGIATMVVLGYLMWWKRRPTGDPRRPVGSAPARGALQRAPWWGVAAVLAVALAVGLFLPLAGASLAAFVVIDVITGLVRRRRKRAGASAG